MVKETVAKEINNLFPMLFASIDLMAAIVLGQHNRPTFLLRLYEKIQGHGDCSDYHRQKF